MWRAPLDVPASELTARSGTLSVEERARAARFLRPEVGSRFTAARGMLRRLLGSYLDVAPENVAFTFNPFGKPALADESRAGGLRFNVSHSHDRALLAFTRGRDLGVDIEAQRPDFATREIAQRFFAPSETSRLLALPEAEQTRAFFQCWTRKEGYIKARGDGLSRSLDSFEVAFGPGVAPAILSASDEPDAALRWTVFNLDPAPNFAGALVVEGKPTRVCLFDVP